MITGESMPVTKKIGDNVTGATINESGALRYRATKIGKDTVLAQIMAFVRSAQSSKAPVQRMADSIAGVFVPIVVLIAIWSPPFPCCSSHARAHWDWRPRFP